MARIRNQAPVFPDPSNQGALSGRPRLNSTATLKIQDKPEELVSPWLFLLNRRQTASRPK